MTGESALTGVLGFKAAAGADVLVCGNAVFKADDPQAAIGAVKGAADEAREAALARGQWD